jgi:hypothetical protein
MHFKSDSRYQGRLRVGYLETGKGPESQVSYSALQPLPSGQIMVGRNYWRGLTFGYDWMPHLFEGGQSGPFAILGAHGVQWSKRSSSTHAITSDPSAPPNHNTDAVLEFPLAVLVNLGLGYRFNPRTTLEFRFVESSSTSSIGTGGKGALFVATIKL